jgi:hypothetical protein
MTQQPDFVDGPQEEDVDAWAEEERRRRQAWLNGPSDFEKQRWARREGRRRAAQASGSSGDGDVWYAAGGLGPQTALAAAFCPFTVLSSLFPPGLVPPVFAGGWPAPRVLVRGMRAGGPIRRRRVRVYAES